MSFSERLRTHGFCVVEIDDEEGQWVDDWETIFHAAFAQKDSVKQKQGVYRVEKGLAVGFRKDDSREFFETRLFQAGWEACEPCYELADVADAPVPRSSYKETVCRMSNMLGDIGEWAIGSVSRHLQLDPTFLVDLTDAARATRGEARDFSSSLMRVCYYPSGIHVAQTNPHATNVAFGSHTDTSFLTVSPCASVSGLEVQDLQTGEWMRPEEQPLGAGYEHVGSGSRSRRVVIFAGEMLEAVTKHRYRACVHRVLSPEIGKRVSCPFLIRCNGDAVFRPSFSGYVHPGGTRALAHLPDLEDMKMGLIQKILDLKRGRCVRQHQGSDQEWVLRAYSEEEQVVVGSDDEDEGDGGESDADADAEAEAGAVAGGERLQEEVD
jgi:isopenicillin N synthase-like dioxygenase